MSLDEQLKLLPENGLHDQLNLPDSALPDRIAAVIRSRIIHDVLLPGSPIRERQLSEELEVSRTPLRDALKILALERLVNLVPNKGAAVADYSIDDVSDMLFVYIELDSLAGQIACRVGTEADFLRVDRQISRMKKAIQETDRMGYFRANQAFHIAIVAASRSKSIIEFHSSLNLRLYRTRYLSILKNDQWMDRTDDHVNILKALRNRDSEAFISIQKSHFSVAWRLIDDWANSVGEVLAR